LDGLASTAALFNELDLKISDKDLLAYVNFPDASRVVAAESLIDEAKKRIAFGSEFVPGLRLPWDELAGDVRITPHTLAIWSGWSHHGKSQMLKQVMLSAIQQGDLVCIASFEEEIFPLFFNMAKMALGTQAPDLAGVAEFGKFAKQKLWFYDHLGFCSAERILQLIRFCADQKKVTQFVIDSLMLISVSKSFDKFSGYVDFVAQLKAIAKESGCTIHLVAHNKKPQGKVSETESGNIHDIAGAHEIGSIADYVFSVWRNKSEPSKREAGEWDAKLTIEKQRGEYNWIGAFPLNFHAASRQFVRGNQAMTFWADDDHVEF
jgi:twinkle protein